MEIESPKEIELQNKLTNLSGLEDWFVRQQVEHVLPIAERIVVFPDLGPTEKGIVPTGSATEIDTLKHPDWLKLVSGADIGCGMLFASLKITKDEFEKDQVSLDKLRDKISEDKSLSLGGGNHFIDFVEDQDHNVSILIHTGAFKDKQKELTSIVKQAIVDGKWEWATAKYLAEYQIVMTSAVENRLALLKAISSIYGESEVMSHEPHNTIEIDKDKHTVVIYKGVAKVTDLSKRQLMPSSMGDLVDYYLPGPIVGEKTLWGVSHGTGRNKSRAEMKREETITTIPKIMLPTGATPPKTELPEAYRTSVRAEEIMLENGLMKYNDTDDILQFKPIAYIGHL